MSSIAELLERPSSVEMQIPAPFGWPGGKRLLSKRIISLIPEHKTYIEPFAGAASVFWAKEPSEVEALNDIDPDLMRFYRDIGSIDHCNIYDISADWDRLKQKQGNLEACEFLSQVLCSFGTKRGANSSDSLGSCFNDAPQFHKYLPQYQERLKKVKLLNEDWEKVVKQYDAPDTFFYFDPPYHGTSREYRYSDDQLARLAEILPKLKGKWVLSYDDDPEIKKAFSNYHILPIRSRYTLEVDNKTMGKQLLIANYPIKLEMKQDDNIEWDAWFTDKMSITHLALLEDHLLDYSQRSTDDQCKNCMLWHCEKLKGYSIYEAPKFFDGDHESTYQKVGELAQAVQDSLGNLAQSEALDYAKKVRDLRYELVGYGVYDFAVVAQEQDRHIEELEQYIRANEGYALVEATKFVNERLGLSIKPRLEVDKDPANEYVAIRIPGEERIIVQPKFLPSDKAGQKTVFIHEVSEIGYEQKGFDQPHTQATDFTWKHWKEAGGKSPKDIHEELIKKGYYHGKESPLDIERMLSGEYYKLPAIIRHSNSKEAEMAENRKFYFCDQTGRHAHWEIIQILTDETNPKCPYCNRVMTYGRYWSSKEAEMAQKGMDINQKWTAIAGEVTDFVMTLARKYDLTIPNINWMLREALKAFKSEKPEGLYLIEYEAKQESPKTIQQLLQEQSLLEQYQKDRPRDIIFFKDTIMKHYYPKEDFHPDSFRVVKPEPGVMVTLGCLKKNKWHPERLECVPTQDIHRTIVPREGKYITEAEEWEAVGVPTEHRETEVGIVPRELEEGYHSTVVPSIAAITTIEKLEKEKREKEKKKDAGLRW